MDPVQKLVLLTDIPQSCVGAPIPLVLAEEHWLIVLYYRQGTKTEYDLVVSVEFFSPYAHFFGPPNDEAISGHPLYSLGLKPCSFFEVQSSAWVNELRKQNSVHPYHKDSAFDDFRHYVLTFHDSTFEVIAKDYAAKVVGDMSVVEAGVLSLQQKSGEL